MLKYIGNLFTKEGREYIRERRKFLKNEKILNHKLTRYVVSPNLLNLRSGYPQADNEISPEKFVAPTVKEGNDAYASKTDTIGSQRRPFSRHSEVDANTAGYELLIPSKTRKKALAEKLKLGTGIVLGATSLAAAGYHIHKGKKSLAKRKKRSDAGQKRGRQKK